MNRDLWIKVVEPLCDRTHSQYGIVAIIRAVMIVANKEIWNAFLEFAQKLLHKESATHKNK